MAHRVELTVGKRGPVAWALEAWKQARLAIADPAAPWAGLFEAGEVAMGDFVAPDQLVLTVDGQPAASCRVQPEHALVAPILAARPLPFPFSPEGFPGLDEASMTAGWYVPLHVEVALPEGCRRLLAEQVLAETLEMLLHRVHAELRARPLDVFERAEAGDAEACWALSQFLYPDDLDRALRWAVAAADRGHARAAAFLARLYWTGERVPRDEAAAVAWAERAGDDPDALYLLAEADRDDPTRLVRAAAAGHGWACFDLGAKLVLAGRDAEALPWLERAIEVGPSGHWLDSLGPGSVAQAHEELGFLKLRAGDGRVARVHLARAARAGLARAGHMLELLERHPALAEAGSLAALTPERDAAVLGTVLAEGLGRARDPEGALPLLRRALAEGHHEAALPLWRLTQSWPPQPGLGREEALAALTAAAEAGLSEAMAWLGWQLWDQGEQAAAARWLARAGEAGQRLAWGWLGDRLRDAGEDDEALAAYGRGREAGDFRSRLGWARLRRDAEAWQELCAMRRDFDPADHEQRMLDHALTVAIGDALAGGLGVARDDQAAAEAYQAARPDVEAALKLGRMLELADPALAIRCYQEAAAYDGLLPPGAQRYCREALERLLALGIEPASPPS